MVIPEDGQEGRKKRRKENPNSRRHSNANDVTVNMLSRQGRHRHQRGPPMETPRDIQYSEADVSAPIDALPPQHVATVISKRTKMKESKAASTVSESVEPQIARKSIDPNILRAKLEFQYLPSHAKVASVVAKCLPHRDAIVFLDHFEKMKPMQARTEEERLIRDTIANTYGNCCKTPIWNLMESLNQTFGASNVEFRRMKPGEYISSGSNTPKTGKVSLKFYLLDCILDRRVCLPRYKTTDGPDNDADTNNAPSTEEYKTTRPTRGDINEVVWKVPCKSEDDLDADNDYKFAHAITVVPDAMLFYTYMERYENPFLSLDMSLIPLGISWLRLLGTKEGWFAKGGYVRYLSHGDNSRKHAATEMSDKKVSAWIIEIFTAGHSADTCRLHAFQAPDLYGPRWPPDIFPDEAGYVADDPVSRRKAYMKLLNDGNTTRIGSRWHVKGTRYSRLSPSALLIAPKLHGPHDITVSIQRSDDEILGIESTKNRDISLVCESVVSIRYLNPMNEKIRSYLHTITKNADLLRKSNTGSVRNDSGDKGNMYALGCRPDPHGKGIIEYAGNKRVSSSTLPDAVEAMEYFGCIAFPSIIRPIQDMERVAGCECLPYLEKMRTIAPTKTNVSQHPLHDTATHQPKLTPCRVGLTMDISSNLCNSAHYDINDANTGFAVWTETIPGNKSQRWYFVLPNVFGKRHDGTTYEGVAIELEHGVAISWDGRRIKHCSFYIENTKSPSNFLYGTFCGTKYNLIECGLNGKGKILPPSENETETTIPASPAVASKRRIHDSSNDEDEEGLLKPIPPDYRAVPSPTFPGTAPTFSAVASMPIDTVGADDIQRDKMKAGLRTVPAINTNDMRVHGRLSEPIPKKHMKYGPIGDDNDRKVAAVQKKSPITEATLDYATMRARCFPSSTNSETPRPHQVVDVTQAAAAPRTPIETAVLLPKNNTPTTKVLHSSPYNWWIQLNHIQKLKFLIDDKSTTEQQGGHQSKQPDLDLILQQIFPRYVLSPPPPDMMAKMETAVQEAVKAINMYYDGAQAQIDTIAAFADSDEDSRQSGGYSSDSTFQGKPVKPSGTYYWGKFVHRANAIEFVRALPRLLLTFTCSFHAQNEDDQQCVCPCSYKAASPWMDKLMDASASSCIAASFETAKCNKRRIRYTARSLLSHLHGSKDPIHQAVHVYVSHIYTHFYAKNTHHEALYRINSSDYNRALIMKYHRRN